MSSLLDLPLEAAGTFEVRTKSGTDFLLELGGEFSTCTRRPGMRKPDDGDAPEPREPSDFAPLTLLGHGDISVGHATSFTVAVGDDVHIHDTRVVVSIEELS